MKTSGVSQNTPPAASKAASDKTTPKTDSKPQKEFKEVLDSDGSKTPPQMKGKFSKIPPKGGKLSKELQKDHQEQPSLLSAGKKPLAGKGDKQDLQEGILRKEETKKSIKEKEDLKEFSVPTTVMMGPAPIQAKAEVQKTQGPALNIREIESIVQKVQVGMNEKGLPEMNFELMTDKLGALTLKVSSENEKVNIQFVTQDAAAQTELQKGLNELSQLLGQRGLNLAETNVMTRDQQQQQQGRDRGGESESSYEDRSVKGRGARKRTPGGPSDDGFTI